MRPTRRKTILSAMVAGLAVTALSGVAAADTAADWWDEMHNSPAMERMREQMPADLQDKCEQMHDRMGSPPAGRPRIPADMGGMMGGSGMMGGPLSAA